MTARSMMDADQIRRAITRLGRETVERHGGTDRLVLIGIQRRGVVLAQRLADAIADRTVVLIDDVLFTGRTVRAAMDALIDFGRPRDPPRGARRSWSPGAADPSRPRGPEPSYRPSRAG